MSLNIVKISSMITELDWEYFSCIQSTLLEASSTLKLSSTASLAIILEWHEKPNTSSGRRPHQVRTLGSSDSKVVADGQCAPDAHNTCGTRICLRLVEFHSYPWTSERQPPLTLYESHRKEQKQLVSVFRWLWVHSGSNRALMSRWLRTVKDGPFWTA